MSVRVMTWVWSHSRAGGTDRLVLLAIADCASDDGTNAWPSIATLALKTGLSERAVQGRVKALCALGELSVEMNAGKHGTNLYRVHMAEQQELAPTPESVRPPQNLHPAESAPPQETTPDPADAAPEPSLTVLPPQPPASGGSVPRCKRHKRRRRECPDCHIFVNPPPPKCSECGPNRLIEDEYGMPVRRCPNCHPASVGAA